MSAPPPGETGSTTSSLTSSMTGREGNATVTVAAGSVITAGITVIATATLFAIDEREASPIKVDWSDSTLLLPLLVVTCCRLGLHSMDMGGGKITRGLMTSRCKRRYQKQVNHTKKLIHTGKERHNHIPNWRS